MTVNAQGTQNIVGLVAFVTAKPRNGKMKLLAILAFVAASLLPALPLGSSYLLAR